MKSDIELTAGTVYNQLTANDSEIVKKHINIMKEKEFSKTKERHREKINKILKKGKTITKKYNENKITPEI